MLKHRKVNIKRKWEMSVYYNNLLLPKGLFVITDQIKCLTLQKSWDSHSAERNEDLLALDSKYYIHYYVLAEGTGQCQGEI